MDIVDSYGYAKLGVPDVDASVAYFQQVYRFAVTEVVDGTTYLSGDTSHHWLALTPSDRTHLIRIGYKATGPEGIRVAKERLAAQGIQARDRSGTDSEQLTGGIIFTDPFGIEFDLYEDMQQFGTPPAGPDVGFDRNLHAVVRVSDPVEASKFYTETLGFRRSDQINDLVVFMRSANRFHHSLAVCGGGNAELDHFCVQMNGLDELMRLRTHFMAEDALGDDIGRHTASGSISMYSQEPSSQIGLEFCTDHAVITEDSSRGRLLKPSPTTVNSWARPFPPLGGDAPASTSATPKRTNPASALGSGDQ